MGLPFIPEKFELTHYSNSYELPNSIPYRIISGMGTYFLAMEKLYDHEIH